MRLDRQALLIWLTASVIWLSIAGGWSYLRASKDLVRLQIDHTLMFPPPVTLRLCDPHDPWPKTELHHGIMICLGAGPDPTRPTLMDAIADNWAIELAAAYLPPILFYLVGLWVRRRARTTPPELP